MGRQEQETHTEALHIMDIVRKKIPELSSTEIGMINVLLERNFCTVFHEIDFNRIVSDVFGTEFSYNLAYDGAGRLIALCPLHSIRDGFLTKIYSNPASFDVRYGGWVFGKNEIALSDLMDRLDLSFNESLTYWSVPQVDSNDYSYLKNKTEFQTGVIDLSFSLDDILYKYVSRKRREAIRSASRKGVVVEKLDLDTLDIFIEQCNYLKTSIGGKSYPRDYFTRLYTTYSSKGQICVLASKIDNQYLASGMIIGNEKMMHLWIAGKPKETNLSVPRQDLLVWEAIKWSKGIGCKYFDLCVIEAVRLPSIAKFKFGFSKQIVPFYLYTRRNFWYRILSRSRQILGSKH